MFRKLLCLSAVCLASALAGTAGAQELGQGKVLFEYWFGGGINNNLDTLKANADFPDNPAQSEWRDGMDRPDWGGMDYWGARGRAFLTPPETGDYTFWTASDDDSELWLSTDADPANAVMIASVEGWCNYQNWTGSGQSPGPNRQSAPIPLVAGETYYIELLFSDGTGGGHASVAWAGPGVGEAPTALKGDVLTALIREPEPLFKAQGPKPADGATDITEPLFEWTPGVTAMMHDIYFGTNPIPGPNDYKGPMPVAMYFHLEPLESGATYYWRIDEIGAAGDKYEGDVWSFTVTPLTAHFPNPYDGALWRRTDLQVSWTAGQGAVSHQVYGDTDQAAVAAGDPNVLLATVADPTLDTTGMLEPATTYYWRVDEMDGAGTVHEGEVWTFSTFDPEGGAIAEYWDNKTLSGDPTIVTIVPEVNFNIGNDSVDPCIPVDNFSCRWTAALNVPVTGTYQLYDATDDGGRLFLNGVQIAGDWVDRGTTEDASDELELVAGERYLLVMEMYESGGGAAAYLRWSGPGIPKEIIPQGALQVPDFAFLPQPADGAEGVGDTPVMSWLPGEGAVTHRLYMGTKKDKVAAADAGMLKGELAECVFVPAALNWNTTYYWKVDEVAEDGTVVPGDVWSFNVADYIPVIDGPVTLDYDNTVEPFVSELIHTLDAPQNWTKNGVSSLQLELKGSFKFMQAGGSYVLYGAGTDIWGNADEFRYAYKSLTGDGTMVARVTSNGTGSNEWAKGGVMIRQSLDAGSTHAFMPITAGGGNGASFQRRLETDGASSNSDSGTAVVPPYWVKIERAGSSFTGSISEDGATWTPLGDPITIEMTDPVLIGLAVTSHASGELRSFEFDNVSATGDVTGDWSVADIGVAQGGNDSAPLYVALEDSAGKSAVVSHPANPDLVLAADWTMWKIPLSKFSGLNLKEITGMIVGVGDAQAGGAGSVQIANVRVVKPIQITVENFSFESPGKPVGGTNPRRNVGILGFGGVPGWSTDKAVGASGIEKGGKPTNGKWTAYLWGGESAIWQTTGHTVVEGEVFQMDLDACITWGAINEKVKALKISLYYDDGGKRVSVASTTAFTPGDPRPYSLTFDALSKRQAVGHNIGVEIANVARNNWLSVDNVRLKVK